ncbi:14098_t:CDS:2 [Entrophospora sp. SA101]|nr:14098_t:CDS:2 [Entrophospora sp. SA101]
MLNKWSEIINILASDNDYLMRHIPPNKVSLDDDDATTNEVKRIANELRDLMNQVNDLKKEIQNKTQEVKRMADLDDIESARITSTGTTKVEPAHFEDLFNQQLAKYDKFFKYIQQATIVQENLHNSINENFKKFNEARRRTKFVNTERDSVIQQLEIGYEKFKEIQKFLSHGIKSVKFLQAEGVLKPIRLFARAIWHSSGAPPIWKQGMPIKFINSLEETPK